MSADDNVKTVESMYEAFSRGDGPAILACLSDEVDWASEAGGNAAPWWGVRTDHAEVGKFFLDFASVMEVDEFTPLAYATNETDVLTIVRLTARSRATGRALTMQLHHWFRFGEDGKVVYYRGSEDTEGVAATLAE